jgi:TPR repeat protein
MSIGDFFMATRSALSIIRSARAGQAWAQLSLGRRYLFGDQDLPRNPASALYWLDRAASQEESDAWLLIGRYVSFDVARTMQPTPLLAQWYERAYEAGELQAGLVFARLILANADAPIDHSLQAKARSALKHAAESGIVEAQWLLAQQLGYSGDVSQLKDATVMHWVACAAHGGYADAQRALSEHAWQEGDGEAFIFWTLAGARSLVGRLGKHDSEIKLSAQECTMLSRCARALLDQDVQSVEGLSMLKLAAQESDSEAQYYLGLWLARMDERGQRHPRLQGLAQYKKAIRWLNLSAQQGHAGAWFSLSCLYRNQACSMRDPTEAQVCLQRAAQAGHAQAQYEMGCLTWRRRTPHNEADVEAIRWLLKAVYQSHAAAEQLLEKITCTSRVADWLPNSVRTQPVGQMKVACPFMSARLALAQAFGLTMAETLLIDPLHADRAHCLLVDIRAQRPRAARRIILIDNSAHRHALEQCRRIFTSATNGVANLEGSYRQRFYRLRTYLKKFRAETN